MGRSKLSNVVSTCDGFAHANFKLCHLVLEVTVECLGLISTTLGGLIGNFHFYYALASTLISIAKQYDLYGIRSDPICNWSSWTNGDGKKERKKKLKTRSKVQHEKKKKKHSMSNGPLSSCLHIYEILCISCRAIEANIHFLKRPFVFFWSSLSCNAGTKKGCKTNLETSWLP